MFRRRFLWAALFALVPLAPASVLAADEPADAKKVDKTVVTVTIDFDDGAKKEITVPFQAKMTVLEALQQAAKHPRGIQFKHRGSGDVAFVTSIDGLENEGSGRNWLYKVNGKSGRESCGIHTLEGGDSVLWQFAKYR